MKSKIQCGFRAVSFFIFLFLLLSLRFGESRIQLSASVQQRALKDIVEHHSFTPPILQNYYVGGELPFWTIRGSTVVTDDYVRLTPDAQKEVGSIWNRHPLGMPEFDIIMGVSISKKPGADGMALWVIQERPEASQVVSGKVHGHSPVFNGFAIVLDTYDNNGLKDNPTVGLLYNNGDPAKVFNAQNDYINDYVASCIVDFRSPNKKYFSVLRVKVVNGSVSVFFSRTQDSPEVHCFTVDDLYLDIPNHKYHIGITAETGGLSQEHDVVFLHTVLPRNVDYDYDVEMLSQEDTYSEQHEENTNKNDKKESRASNHTVTETQKPSTTNASTQDRVKELEEELKRLKKLASKSSQDDHNDSNDSNDSDDNNDSENN